MWLFLGCLADLTPKELFLVAEMLTNALLVKSYIKTMYRCSFKGFRTRVDLYSDHTNAHTNRQPSTNIDVVMLFTITVNHVTINVIRDASIFEPFPKILDIMKYCKGKDFNSLYLQDTHISPDIGKTILNSILKVFVYKTISSDGGNFLLYCKSI